MRHRAERPAVAGIFLRATLSIVLLVGQCMTPLSAHYARSSPEPSAAHAASASQPTDSVYETTYDKGYRFNRDGWIYVHLEGAPHDIGFQHGYLLAPEIADAFAAVRLEMTHESGRNWDFFRRAAQTMLWPKIDPEYQAEIHGIVDGLEAQKTKLDENDIVAMNAFQELPDYYVPWLDERTHSEKAHPPLNTGGHCSAFIANGTWTKDHQIVMAHNNWTSYMAGSRWRVIFDIVPKTGNRMLMDGFPGVIASDDDFGVNSAGLMVTETTITNFHGWNTLGKAEFVRARKAMQYANSIDDYVKIMLDGNNGGYANDWLLGDRKTGEIARFELGLQHYKVWRTMDGYYSGANFASDPDVIRDETTFDAQTPSSSPNARRIRWDQLLTMNKGNIDTAMAESFLSDHFDTFTKKDGPNGRTLCGHGDVDSEGEAALNVPAYYPHGSVSGKVMDGHMAEQMQFIARIGHPCGIDFKAVPFLAAHKEYSWQSPVLDDMLAGPWSTFKTGQHTAHQYPN